jgi:hypothetical protein
MMSSSDPFSASFDSIDLSGKAPSKEAFDHAFEVCAPSAAEPEFVQPGFYLIDDARGRFVVDRDMGVVSVKDEATLQQEQGSVHSVTLRVVERSGESYELPMQLRVTGMIPQMVGAEENDFFATAAYELKPRKMVALRIDAEPETAAPRAPEPVATVSITPWNEYAVANAKLGKGEIVRPRRSLIVPPYPTESPLTHAALNIADPLPPVGSPAPWSL